jgi:hypothetical protein
MLRRRCTEPRLDLACHAGSGNSEGQPHATQELRLEQVGAERRAAHQEAIGRNDSIRISGAILAHGRSTRHADTAAFLPGR